MNMKNNLYKSFGFRKGFSLAEALASVVIGAIVMVAMVRMHGQAERNAAAAFERLDSTRLPAEILQLIAEDLDRIVGAGTSTVITINNKFIDGYPSAQLVIRSTMKGQNNTEKEFETVTWQAGYDMDSMVEGLVMYRGKTGMIPSDKLLDSQRAAWEESYTFVPVCEGITYFTILVPQRDQLLTRWAGNKLPQAIVVTISFAEPIEMADGTIDVPEEEKFTRTIAIDRTRKINFTLVREVGDDQDDIDEEEDEEDGDEGETSDADETDDEDQRLPSETVIPESL